MKKQPSLIVCIIMDIIGYGTYALPFFGELGDAVWAPISALIFFQLFGGVKGAVGGIFNFIEEFLPFTDFIPTFTIMWLWQYFRKEKVSPQLSEVTVKPVQ
jgi:hypothetical protein